MSRHIAEFVGTFFLVLAVCLAPSLNLGTFAPLAVGLTLMVMVYACGHISGAMFNPAVTFGIMLRGKLRPKEAALFAVTQVLAAVAAAGIAIAFVGSRADTDPVRSAGAALGAEFIGAFALVFVVLNVSTAVATKGNSYFGVAIGLTVTAMALVVGRYSGGAFNPAVAVGAAISGGLHFSGIWIHILGSLGGGGVAALVFRMTHPDE